MFFNFVLDNSRTGHADVNGALALGQSRKRARHKRVIVHGVAKHDELAAPERIDFARAIRKVFNYFTELADRVHVYAGLARRDVDRRTHNIRFGQRLRNSVQKFVFARSRALLHERGITADKVHAEVFARAVERVRKPDKIPARRTDNRRGRNGNALIDNLNAVPRREAVAHGHKPSAHAHNLVVNLGGALFAVAVDTVQKRQRRSDRPHVEVPVIEHVYSFEYFVFGKHKILYKRIA